jgi:hypothetical protein
MHVSGVTRITATNHIHIVVAWVTELPDRIYLPGWVEGKYNLVVVRGALLRWGRLGINGKTISATEFNVIDSAGF